MLVTLCEWFTRPSSSGTVCCFLQHLMRFCHGVWKAASRRSCVSSWWKLFLGKAQNIRKRPQMVRLIPKRKEFHDRRRFAVCKTSPFPWFFQSPMCNWERRRCSCANTLMIAWRLTGSFINTPVLRSFSAGRAVSPSNVLCSLSRMLFS